LRDGKAARNGGSDGDGATVMPTRRTPSGSQLSEFGGGKIEREREREARGMYVNPQMETNSLFGNGDSPYGNILLSLPISVRGLPYGNGERI
jgi:hypothetical protein